MLLNIAAPNLYRHQRKSKMSHFYEHLSVLFVIWVDVACVLKYEHMTQCNTSKDVSTHTLERTHSPDTHSTVHQLILETILFKPFNEMKERRIISHCYVFTACISVFFNINILIVLMKRITVCAESTRVSFCIYLRSATINALHFVEDYGQTI